MESRFLGLLLPEPTVERAAAAARLPHTTAYRLLKRPDFKAAYREAKRENVAQALARLQAVGGKAVDALVEVMEDGAAPSSARVAAARTALELALRASELEDMTERLAAIEERLASVGEAAAAKNGNGRVGAWSH
jgi:hypothetical protein